MLRILGFMLAALYLGCGQSTQTMGTATVSGEVNTEWNVKL
jgi:hypothetical protein